MQFCCRTSAMRRKAGQEVDLSVVASEFKALSSRTFGDFGKARSMEEARISLPLRQIGTSGGLEASDRKDQDIMMHLSGCCLATARLTGREDDAVEDRCRVHIV